MRVSSAPGWILAGSLLLPTSVLASPPVALAGEYRLAGPLDEKGVPGPGRSHLYVSLTEAAARSLYEALPGEPIEDVCTGYRVKSQGNVACYETVPGERYLCGFSVRLGQDAVEAGLGGCI